jgi:hypothetical protein
MPPRASERNVSAIMKSKIKILFQWFWLNFRFFILVFGLVWGLILLYPKTMLGIFERWAFVLKMAGAQNLNEFSSSLDMFIHILTRNGIAIIIYFIIGWFLQSPLVMIFTGAVHCVFNSPHDWQIL